MIKTPLTKILFLDIETVGGCKNLDDCKKNNPAVANQFTKYYDWFLKRFPEDQLIETDQKNKVFETMSNHYLSKK